MMKSTEIKAQPLQSKTTHMRTLQAISKYFLFCFLSYRQADKLITYMHTTNMISKRLHLQIMYTHSRHFFTFL